ncbi:MAG: ribonuclease HII [bacterium]
MKKNIDKEYFSQGFNKIVGVDEAGRGPLCGPVVTAAVSLTGEIKGLRDSKKLSVKKREELLPLIINNSIWSVYSVLPHIIDRMNILGATLWGMKRVINRIIKKTGEETLVLIDGNKITFSFKNEKAVVGGDGKSESIAAASVLAKTHRDKIMKRWAYIYPEYGIEKHKGYPTEHHYNMLEKYGSTPIHRKSFRLSKKPFQETIFS